jgi:hypothetical protein
MLKKWSIQEIENDLGDTSVAHLAKNLEDFVTMHMLISMHKFSKVLFVVTLKRVFCVTVRARVIVCALVSVPTIKRVLCYRQETCQTVSIVHVMSQDSDFSKMSVRLSMLVLFTVLTGTHAHAHAHTHARTRARAHTHTHTHNTHTEVQTCNLHSARELGGMTVMRHMLRLYLRPLVGCDTIGCVDTWRGKEA